MIKIKALRLFRAKRFSGKKEGFIELVFNNGFLLDDSAWVLPDKEKEPRYYPQVDKVMVTFFTEDNLYLVEAEELEKMNLSLDRAVAYN